MTKLSSKILGKIKKEKMTPKPRWYFILMHTLLGTAILTSIIIGGISVAIVIRHFTATNWELARQFTGGHFRSLFMLMPYVWIIFIGLTILLADLLFKHTKKGYKVAPWKLVTASIMLSAILGGLFFAVKADRPVEEGLHNLRPYAEWARKKDRLFAAPEKGVLAGEIVEVNSDEEWIIVDFKGQKWRVDISEARKPIHVTFEAGMRVGMLGKKLDEDHFKAVKIAPWRKEIIKNERKFRELP